MTPQQYQHYSFLEESRKRAMYHHLLTQQSMSILRKAIQEGKDPRVDPELRKYWVLIDEASQEILIHEMKCLNLTLEEDSIPTEDAK